MKHRIFLKLMIAFALVIATTAGTLDFAIRQTWEDSLRQEIERNLRQKTVIFADLVNSARQSRSLEDLVRQEGQAAGVRATIIDATGKVLADSQAESASMENHSRRPEFVAAARGEVGVDLRKSQTLGISFLYAAAPVSGGAVRLAYPLSDLEAASARVQNRLILASAAVFTLALMLAALAANSISRRLQRIVRFSDQIAAGNLGARIAESSEDEIGQVAGALDKTARKLEASFAALQTSQRQLETLLNSMQDAVIAVGPDQRVQWANQMMDRLVHHNTRLDAPVVETVRDPDFLRALRTASASGTVSVTRATSILPSHTYDVTAAPMPGGGAVAVLRDLTENERVEKTRRDFIANVSHELRTPLTSIQGYTETLLDATTAEDPTRDFLEIVRKNATRMSRLTEDLLALARVESGEQRFDMQSVSPDELLQEAIQSFEEAARAQGVELRIEDSSRGEVLADREAIHQVFTNLIENALKYASGGKDIVLGARSVETGVEFSVRDFGPGIASEHLPRLFERFYRVDKARSRESGGTGLGLAIAKHIVLAHRGTIQAESELNHGSVFLFTLPSV